MNPSSEPRPESLITEQDWVRPLVKRLVRDEASAEDVLQSTWLRSLRSPPRAERGSPSWRGWFLRVARNLASREGQRESSRKQREARAARGESLPSMLEISEREELRAKIVAHVLALPEPYKTTLVLRFYEGLAPRAIARAQRTNASTVRNRIARGLALLRERLEREQGREWVSGCLAVLPLVSAQWLAAQAGWTSWTGWIAKGGVVAKKIEIATAAAVVVAAGAVWFAWPAPESANQPEIGRGGEAPLSKEAPALAPAPAGPGALLEDVQAGTRAEAGATQRRPADTPGLAVTPAGVRVHGHVRDARGEPINQSGGTFRLQMGGELIQGDVPVIELPEVEVEGQAQPRVRVELSVEMLRTAQLDESRDMQEVRVPAESLDAVTGEGMKGLFRNFVLHGSTRIVITDAEGCQFTAGTDMESSYSVDGLHAGKWRAIVTHDGKLSGRLEFEIPEGERQHLLDITLDDALRVRVRMRTPEGRELAEAVAADPELSYRVELLPVALRPGSAARYLPDGGSSTYGCGSYQPRGNLDEEARTEIGDASGVLTLTEAPPLDVCLLVCGQPVARRSLSPGEDLVDFELSLDDLRRLYSTVTVRVVDAGTHLPIPNASVTIYGVRTLVAAPPPTQPGGDVQDALDEIADKRRAEDNQPRTDAKGMLQIPWVLAGPHKIYVGAQGYAAFRGSAVVETGGSCELKPIELTGEARISGRLLDERGNPLSLSFQLVPLDRFEEVQESLDAAVWSSDGGRFEVPGQRRERYVLRVVEGDSVLSPALIDASQGDVADLELRLATGRKVRVAYSREPREGAQLRVTTAAGLPVIERDLAGIEPSDVLLAPGSYSVEVREGKRRVGQARIVVKDEPLRIVLGLE